MGCWSSREAGLRPLFPPLRLQAEQAKSQVEELLHRSPRLCGVDRSTGSLATLRPVVKWMQTLTLSGICQILERFDLHYKRGRQHVHFPDPLYTEKLAAIEQARKLIRPGGTVVVVGLAPRGSKVTLPAFDFISEKNIRGCFYGSSHFRADVPVILKRIQAGRMHIDGMVSHSVPLEDLEAAFNRLRNGDGARTILRF